MWNDLPVKNKAGIVLVLLQGKCLGYLVYFFLLSLIFVILLELYFCTRFFYVERPLQISSGYRVTLCN